MLFCIKLLKCSFLPSGKTLREITIPQDCRLYSKYGLKDILKILIYIILTPSGGGFTNDLHF